MDQRFRSNKTQSGYFVLCLLSHICWWKVVLAFLSQEPGSPLASVVLLLICHKCLKPKARNIYSFPETCHVYPPHLASPFHFTASIFTSRCNNAHQWVGDVVTITRNSHILCVQVCFGVVFLQCWGVLDFFGWQRWAEMVTGAGARPPVPCFAGRHQESWDKTCKSFSILKYCAVSLGITVQY